MDVLPVRPQPAVRSSSATSRGTSRTTAAAKTTAHAAGAHAEPPAGPDDVALLAQQAAFDRMMQSRAELQREANALRDLAMEQIKRDDALMGQWIKMI